jgi:hypothetical protein
VAVNLVQCGKGPGGCRAVLGKELFQGTLGNALGEFGPAVLPMAAAPAPVVTIVDFVEFTAQTRSQNHKNLLLGFIGFMGFIGFVGFIWSV